MYCELLAASLAEAGRDEHRSADLVAVAVERRRALRSPGVADAASGVAVQLAYDLALLRLCWASDVDADPAGFTQPLPERRRLEGLLAAKGVDLAALSANGGAQASVSAH